MKFIAIYEAPCVGTTTETFEADSVREAQEIAWLRTCDQKEYVVGGFDLFSITWDHYNNKWEFNNVTHMDTWEDELCDILDELCDVEVEE